MKSKTMRSVILCEGNDDAWFLSYYLYKVAEWNTRGAKSKWGKTVIPCDIDGQDVIYMIHPKSYNLLAIKSTKGQSNFITSVQDILHLSESMPSDPIQNLIIFRDCDDRSDETLLREMESWFQGRITLHNNSISQLLLNEEFELVLNILPLIIPFDEPGAIETLLMQAIADQNDEGKFITEHAKSFIDAAKQKLSTYLKSQREVTKARYAAAMAIYDPTHSRDTFNQLMMGTPWQESASIRYHMNKALQLILNNEE